MSISKSKCAVLCGLAVIFGSYCVGNEFIKKSPSKVRKEKAQKESLSEQCGRTLDELLIQLFDMQPKIARFCKTGYQTLRSVACGESCVVDSADIAALKNVVACLEQCATSIKQLEDALEKAEQSLSA